MTRRSVRRPAFTLLELMVVIGVIIVLATLAAAFLPNLDRNKGVANQVTQLHGWFNLSKMQAYRDGSAHGIRLFDDGGGRVTTMQYIEQPEPVAPRGPGIKVYIRTEMCFDPLLFQDTTRFPNNLGPLTVVTLFQDSPANPYMPSYQVPPPQPMWLNWDGVTPGDYFQLTGSPTAMAGIRRFSTPPLPTPPGFPPAPTLGGRVSQLILDRVIEGTEISPNPNAPPPFIGNVIVSANNFRVLRQPRPLVGEPLLHLHKDVFIDLTRSHPCPVNLAAAKAFPPNTAQPNGPIFQGLSDWTPYGDVNGQPYLDVLFNSTGAVANAPFGQVILWVQHNERPNDVLLLTISTRTGKVGPYNAFDLDPTQYDPYGLARSGQSPGL